MRLLSLFAVLCLLPAAAVQDEVHVLKPGEPYTGEFDVGQLGDGSLTFAVHIPREAIGLEIELTCPEVDLDLFVSGPAADSLSDEPTPHSAGYGVERVLIDFVSAARLETGRYEISVEYPGPANPIWRGRKLSTARFELVARLHRAEVDGELTPGTPVVGSIESVGRRLRSFTIKVPKDVNVLRLDVVETVGDLDLHVRRGGPILRREQITHEAVQPYGRETLVITSESRPRLRPGRWYVDVIDYGDRQWSVPFTLLATFDASPPEIVLGLESIQVPEDQGPIARAAHAVVDLYAGEFQGSGTLLAAEGWILTNAHVVTDYADRPMEEVVVAVSSQPRHPPVESFRARVVEFDWELDLALLKVETGFYGQEVPAEYRFPFVPLARGRALELGDSLWAIGYPWAGGSGGRVSVTVTTGIVSGFEDVGRTVLIKADVGLSNGNSGGAALNARGELVGVPTSIVEDGSNQISFLVPVEAIPESWLGHL